MATIGKITQATSGTAAVKYAEGKEKLKASTKQFLLKSGVDSHVVDQLHDRAVVKSGMNVDPEFASTQMKATRSAFGTTGKETVRVIQSFSTADLNPANPKDWQKANEIGYQLARKAFSGHQVAIYTQLDGTGHKLHNHIVVNMPNLKNGKKYHQHHDWQRLSAISDDICREHGLSVIERSKDPRERRTMAERQLKAKNEYVWKDDLRAHIDSVMKDTSVSSYKAFSECLAESGIITHERGKSLSFEFLDAKNKHRRARGKTLGADYEKEQIFNELERRDKQPSQSASNSRTSTLSRAFEQRKQQAEQRERNVKSREPATSQSAKGIERLTVATGQNRSHISSTSKEFSTHVQRTKHRTRDFGTRVKRLGGQISNFSNAISAIAGKIGRYLKQLQAQKQDEQDLFNQLQDKLDQSRQHKEERDNDNGYYRTYQNRGFHR